MNVDFATPPRATLTIQPAIIVTLTSNFTISLKGLAMTALAITHIIVRSKKSVLTVLSRTNTLILASMVV